MDSPPEEYLDARERKRLYNKRYRIENKERLRERRHSRYDASARAKKLDYYRRNRERILRNKREYDKRNRASIIAYRVRNAEKRRGYDQKWCQQNRERRRETQRKSDRRRRERATNRIAFTLRSRLRRCIKSGGAKPAKTEKLLGCSFDEFCGYIERQFRRGMTWENYARAWHIDHIIPCSAFDLTRPEHARQCFHFTNLRPLWAKANIRKGAKITDPQLKLLL